MSWKKAAEAPALVAATDCFEAKADSVPAFLLQWHRVFAEKPVPAARWDQAVAAQDFGSELVLEMEHCWEQRPVPAVVMDQAEAVSVFHAWKFWRPKAANAKYLDRLSLPVRNHRLRNRYSPLICRRRI